MKTEVHVTKINLPKSLFLNFVKASARSSLQYFYLVKIKTSIDIFGSVKLVLGLSKLFVIWYFISFHFSLKFLTKYQFAQK